MALRARRAIAGAARTIAYTGVFVSAAVAGLALHLDLPPARRAIISGVNGALDDAIQGDLTIESVDDIDLDGVDGVQLSATSPEGQPVLRARGVSADVSLFTLLTSFVSGGPIQVDVEQARVRRAEVWLSRTSTGELAIQETFMPPPSPPPAQPGPDVAIRIADANIEHIETHVELAEPAFDASVEAVRGSLTSDPDQTVITIDGAVFGSSQVPVVADVSGSLEGKLTAPTEGPVGGRANVAARVGDVPVRVTASVDGDRVDAGLLIPTVQPEALQSILPGVQLQAPVSLSAAMGGTLPELTADTQVHVGQGRGRVFVRADLTPPLSASLDAALQRIDPAALDPAAPTGSIDLSARASADDLASDTPSGSYEVYVPRARLAGQPLPDTRVWGEFEGRRVQGQLKARRHDTTVDGSFAVAPTPGQADDLRIVSSLDARLPSFRALEPWLDARGSGRLRADATVTLDEAPRVQGNLRARVNDLRVGAMRLDQASVAASVEGTFETPWVDARLEGTGAEIAFLKLSQYRLEAEGSARAPIVNLDANVEDGGAVHARTALDIGDRTATGTSVRLEGKRPLHAQIDRIRAGPEGVNVDRFRLDGLGNPLRASFALRGDRMQLRAQGRDLHFARLGPWLPPALDGVSGLVSLDVDLAASPWELEGHAQASLIRGQLDGFVHDIRAALEMTAHDDDLSLQAYATLDDTTRIILEAPEVELQGEPLSPEAWRRAVGKATLDAYVDLNRLEELVPADGLPVNQLDGKAELHVRARREHPDAGALIDVRAATEGFQGVLGDPRTASGTRITNIDANLRLFAETKTGQIELQGGLLHEDRYLVSTNFEARLPLDMLLSEPSESKRLLAEAMWTGTAVVPRQKVRDLPPFLQPPGLQGRLESTVSIEGPAVSPTVRLHSKLSSARFDAADRVEKVPLDIELNASFADERGEATALFRDRGATVATLESDLELDPGQLLGPRPGDADWALSTELDLDGFPARAVAPLVGAPIGGCLFGEVKLKDLHRDASLLAKVWSDEVRAGPAETSNAQLYVRFEDGELAARAKLKQAEGSLDIGMKTGLDWGAALVPSMTSDSGLETRLEAKSFDLSSLEALAGRGELDGTIDADLYARAPAGNLSAGSIRGHMRLSDGVLNLAQIGQRLHGIEAEFDIEPTGEARLRRLEVRTPSGLLKAAGAARLEGMVPVAARAVVRVPKKSPFPIVYEGVDYGTVFGEVDLSAEWNDRLDLTAKVDELHVELPPKPSTQVQALALDETIEVGKVRPSGRFVHFPPRFERYEPEPDDGPAAPGPMEARIRVVLGKDVLVTRGTDLRAEVQGQTTVLLGEGEPQVRGAIEIPSGTVFLSGREFEIVEATLSFNGQDPGNPIISATAEYDAPGEYVVTAEFTGTVEAGELTLSSNPSLPRSQILNLIAFGSPAGPAGAESGGGGSSAAAGLVGGKVTQGVNALIGSVTSLDVSTRLDTSHEDVRPEVAVQVTPEVTAQVTFVPTEPSPGQNPDRTLLTLEYRFLPQWTLEASVGDEGTSVLDLLWRYRY